MSKIESDTQSNRNGRKSNGKNFGETIIEDGINTLLWDNGKKRLELSYKNYKLDFNLTNQIKHPLCT